MGAVALTALNVALSAEAALRGSAAWIPPEPSLKQAEETALLLAAAPTAGELDYETGPIPPPPIPPVIPNVIELDPDNAFPIPPFDENGCPYIAPSQMAALATLPYSGFSAILEPEGELPPLPEGYDVMPLAQGTGLLVETEDMFRFRAISTSNNVAVSFFGRVQRPSGYILPFNFTLNTTTANTTFTTTQQCGKGLLLGCAASVPIGSITSGAVNAIGEIGRVQGSTFTPHTLLFAGQLDDLYPLTIDGGGLPPMTQRPTFQNTSNAASVASPKSITITPGTNKRLRITRAQATITTDATAGVRSASIAFVTGGVSIFTSISGGSVGPSCAPAFFAAMGGNGSDNFTSGTSGGIPMSCPLPETLYFYEAVTVQIGIEGGAAGDRVSNMFLRWEES